MKTGPDGWIENVQFDYKPKIFTINKMGDRFLLLIGKHFIFHWKWEKSQHTVKSHVKITSFCLLA